MIERGAVEDDTPLDQKRISLTIFTNFIMNLAKKLGKTHFGWVFPHKNVLWTFGSIRKLFLKLNHR